jgi:hypothetical protein
MTGQFPVSAGGRASRMRPVDGHASPALAGCPQLELPS